MKKPFSAQEDHCPADLKRALSACLQVADGLGARLMDTLTVVGGLAPYLLVPPETLPPDTRHVGTLDLDLGLALADSQEPRLYKRIAESLGASGFSADLDRKAQEPLQWKWPASGIAQVWVDIIPDAEIGGVAPWLPEIRFALVEREAVDLRGRTLDGKEVRARVWMCNAAAFLLLKAIAFRRRRERKDAHDLYFVLRYHQGDILESVVKISRDPEGGALLEVLREHFADHDGAGARAVAEFLSGRPDDEIQADVVGATQRILKPLHLVE